MAAVRIGILGAARIAPNAIVKPAADVANATITAVAARDPARARAFAAEHGIASVLDGYGAVVNSPDVDLVYNPLPVNLHAEWTVRALEAGKHVLCEKPFAMNRREADRMLDAARQNDVRVIEAFHYRYHPMFITLLDWLAAGRVGEIRSLRAHFNVGVRDEPDEIRRRIETGGGAMMDLGCYPLNWALQTVDRPIADISAQATLTDTGVDETMEVQIDFEGGVGAELHTSMHEDEAFSAALTITGSEATIHFRNPLSPHRGGELLLERDGDTTAAPRDTRPTYSYQLEAVVETLPDGPRLPTEGDIILAQQSALDEVYAAAGLSHLRHPAAPAGGCS